MTSAAASDPSFPDVSRPPLPGVLDREADPAGPQLWDSPHWSWSPDVQDRLRTAVQRAAAGEVVSYGDTMRTPGNMLVTVDLTVAPVVTPTGVSDIVCSVVDPEHAGPAMTLRMSGGASAIRG